MLSLTLCLSVLPLALAMEPFVLPPSGSWCQPIPVYQFWAWMFPVAIGFLITFALYASIVYKYIRMSGDSCLKCEAQITVASPSARESQDSVQAQQAVSSDVLSSFPVSCSPTTASSVVNHDSPYQNHSAKPYLSTGPPAEADPCMHRTSSVLRYSESNTPLCHHKRRITLPFRLSLYLLVYLVCWGPDIIVSFLYWLSDTRFTVNCRNYMLDSLSMFALGLQGLINAIVYFLTTRSIRNQFPMWGAVIVFLLAPLLVIVSFFKYCYQKCNGASYIGLISHRFHKHKKDSYFSSSDNSSSVGNETDALLPHGCRPEEEDDAYHS